MSERIVRRAEAAYRLSISLTSLWRRERDGSLPPSRKFGPNVSGWLASDFEAAVLALASRSEGAKQ